MAENWTRETIRAELEAISTCLDEPVDAYLVGGSAMVAQEFKPTTPDIDLIVPSEQDIERLRDAMVAAGCACAKRQETDGTITRLQFVNDKGREIDVFNTQIGDGLILSDGIRQRSEPYIETARADISVISPEDIYLSKLAHSSRLKDSGDTTALSRADLDFDVVREELAAQNELADEKLPNLLLFDQPDE